MLIHHKGSIHSWPIKHHPNLNLALLDINKIEKKMLAMEAEPISVVIMNIEVEVGGVEGDAGSTVLVMVLPM